MPQPQPDWRTAFQQELQNLSSSPKSHAEKITALRRQLSLLDQPLRFVCLGPPRNGWPRSDRYCYRCTRCGYIMPAADDTYDNCFCGAMNRDMGAGRFGSNHGDNAIETLEIV